MTGQAIAVAVSFLETILLARYLEVSQLGLFLILLAACELTFGLLDCRSGEAVIKFLPEFQEAGGQRLVGAMMRCIILVDSLLGVMGFAVVCGLAVGCGRWFPSLAEHGGLMMAIAAGYAVKATMSSAGSYLRVTRAFPLAVKVGMLASLLRLCLLVAMVLTSPSLRNACVVVALAEGVTGICLLVALLWRTRHDGITVWGRRLGVPRHKLVPIIRFMVQTNLAVTIRVLAKKGDVIAIAALSSSSVVALYKIALRLAGTALLFSDPLVTVVYPTLSRLSASGKHKEIRTLIGFLSRIFALAAVCLIIGFALFGRSLFGWVLGSQYQAAFPAALVMLTGFCFTLVFFWTRPLMLVHGLTLQNLNIGVVAIVAQYMGLVLLVPKFGPVGGAVSVVAYQVTAVTCGLYAIAVYQKKLARQESQPTRPPKPGGE